MVAEQQRPLPGKKDSMKDKRHGLSGDTLLNAVFTNLHVYITLHVCRHFFTISLHSQFEIFESVNTSDERPMGFHPLFLASDLSWAILRFLCKNAVFTEVPERLKYIDRRSDKTLRCQLQGLAPGGQL